MKNTDLRILQSVIDNKDSVAKVVKAEGIEDVFAEHPLDEEVLKSLQGLVNIDEKSEFAIFKKVDEIKELWTVLIKKSINCLRFYDSREPFHTTPAKKPHAYGIDELRDYFDKYTEFESLLYGGSKYYRDHVVHVFRVWLLGIDLLLRNNGQYLKDIVVEANYIINPLEKLSIWTLIALTHDLGYPLEKSLQVIDKTREMMKSFIVNPVVSMDLSFNGVQNSMNDFVLRFIGSKMHKKNDTYVARLQPKYFFKIQKSLEHNNHGVLSSLIIYKMLTFFLESDYSINEDYSFSEEDSRQFYIRRDILRSIASHTCHDIYQLNIYSFSFLLILCDDAQEWGRKSISDLYIERGEVYKYEGIEIDFTPDGNTCSLMDKYEVEKTASLKSILDKFAKQSKKYRDVFRDGQETNNRNFDFIRQEEIDITGLSPTKNYILRLIVTRNEPARIIATRTNGDKLGETEVFAKELKDVFGDYTYNEAHTEIIIPL